MKQEKLEEVMILTKRIGNLLNEVMDISAQLSDAIDRRDEVSMQMILAMRAEPIGKLMATDDSLREYLETLDQEDAARIREILNGDESKASDALEKLLAGQAALNIRTHGKVIEQDKVLNRKIAREKSIYQ